MYIIIIGAGHVGINLTKQLSYEKHDVIIIESTQERYMSAAETLDAKAFYGSGTDYKLLEKAAGTPYNPHRFLTRVERLSSTTFYSSCASHPSGDGNAQRMRTTDKTLFVRLVK